MNLRQYDNTNCHDVVFKKTDMKHKTQYLKTDESDIIKKEKKSLIMTYGSRKYSDIGQLILKCITEIRKFCRLQKKEINP